MNRRRTLRWAIVGLGLTVAISSVALATRGPRIDATPTAQAGNVAQQEPRGAELLLPDLRMAALYGLDLETTSQGRKRLHFGTIGWNLGDGPFEIRGKKIPASEGYMRVKQRIYDSQDGHIDRMTPALLLNHLDHQNHWDLRQFIVNQMYDTSEPAGDVFSMRKVGYCILDARRKSGNPPGQPSGPQYFHCGNNNSTSLVTGLSIGYGDDYPPYWTLQWIDVNGIDEGDYRICTTIDPLGEFRETDESNNQRWTDVHIDPAAGTVEEIDTAIGPCGPST